MGEPITIVDRDILKVLSVDTRMDILKLLAEGDRMPSYISKKLGKTDATIVEHLNVLVKAGLVKKIVQPGKRWIFYTLTDKGYGIIASKSRKLVIILGTSLALVFGGASSLIGYLYNYGGGGALTATLPEALGPAARSVDEVALMPDALLLYVAVALFLFGILGIGYYLIKRRKAVEF